MVIVKSCCKHCRHQLRKGLHEPQGEANGLGGQMAQNQGFLGRGDFNQRFTVLWEASQTILMVSPVGSFDSGI